MEGNTTSEQEIDLNMEKYNDEDEDAYDDENWSNENQQESKFDKWLNIDDLPSPDGIIELKEILGEGTYGRVFKATEMKSGREVAVKIVEIMLENLGEIEEEYNTLNTLGLHPNFPIFYGAFTRTTGDPPKKFIWLVMELCEGGSILDLVWTLKNKDQHLDEHIIAFVMKEVVSAVHYMHRHHIIHRDIKGHNVLLTSSGQVKLVDFGVSTYLKKTMDRMHTCVGTPYWMAPEVITCEQGTGTYDGRCDVWSIGITAIELANGAPPLDNLQPILAMFQIVRNPPPTLPMPLEWSEMYNDFVAECLTKNPEHRPCLYELKQHPFITELLENDFFVMNELSGMLKKECILPTEKEVEVTIKSGFLKVGYGEPPMPIFPSDLAILDEITDDHVLKNIEERLKLKQCYTYAGDVLLFIKSKEESILSDLQNIRNNKYEGKARSDNVPHIYAVADSAYQDLLHHNEQQAIVLMGESGSGKTENAKLVIKHLAYLGKCNRFRMESKMKSIFPVLEMFGNARTLSNGNASRFINFTDVCFSKSGKVTGAIIRAYMLEKSRITGKYRNGESNYHSFTRIFEGMKFQGKLADLCLQHIDIKNHRYLPGNTDDDNNALKHFLHMDSCLSELAFNTEERELIYTVLSAILLLGELQFGISDEESKQVTVANSEVLEAVSKLLKIDTYKLQRVVSAEIKRNCALKYTSNSKNSSNASDYMLVNATDTEHALQTVDSISTLLYIRLFDWIVNLINANLYFSRLVFGDLMSVSVIDPPGYVSSNSVASLHDLFFNITTEQISYFTNQKLFANECVQLDLENIEGPDIEWTDNRNQMNIFLSQNHGLLSLIYHHQQGSRQLSKSLDQMVKKHAHYLSETNKEFIIKHSFGDVTYDKDDLHEKQKDVVAPEIIRVLQSSQDSIISSMFSDSITKTGKTIKISISSGNLHRNMNILQTNNSAKNRANTLSKGCKNQLTYAPSDPLHLLNALPVMSEHLVQRWPHFVFCVNPYDQSSVYNSEKIRHNLGFYNITNAVKLKKKGFSHRVSFQNFLDRYKYLGFDWDENVEVNGENCRLLLLRLLMEGWIIGKSKVFLKYYNVEYLSRLYESHVKKIVKVQAAVRRFLAKLKKSDAQKSIEEEKIISEAVAKRMKEAEILEDPNEETDDSPPKEAVRSVLIIQKYFRRWKFMNLFQIFQKYRMSLQTTLVDFCQQVHIYNQEIHGALRQCDNEVDDDLITSSPSGHLESLCRALPKFSRLKMKLPISRMTSTYLDTKNMLHDDNKMKDDDSQVAIPVWNAAYEALAPQTSKYIPKRKRSCVPKLRQSSEEEYSKDISLNEGRRPSVTFSENVSVQNQILEKLRTRDAEGKEEREDKQIETGDIMRRKSEGLLVDHKEENHPVISILKKSSTEPCVRMISEGRSEDLSAGSNNDCETKKSKANERSAKVRSLIETFSQPVIDLKPDEFLLVKSKLRKVKKKDDGGAAEALEAKAPETNIKDDIDCLSRKEVVRVDESDQGPVDFRAVLRKKGQKTKGEGRSDSDRKSGNVSNQEICSRKADIEDPVCVTKNKLKLKSKSFCQSYSCKGDMKSYKSEDELDNIGSESSTELQGTENNRGSRTLQKSSSFSQGPVTHGSFCCVTSKESPIPSSNTEEAVEDQQTGQCSPRVSSKSNSKVFQNGAGEEIDDYVAPENVPCYEISPGILVIGKTTDL